MIKQTYPNQRMVKVHRERVTADFLGIKNENWKAASRNMRPPALLLYLYLASNADDFTLALSPAAIRQEIGMARSTYHDQFHILVDKGYLVHTKGNTYEFYEVPQPRTAACGMNFELTDGHNFENDTDSVHAEPKIVNIISGDNTEINNIDESKDSGINIEQELNEESDIDLSNIPVGEFKF